MTVRCPSCGTLNRVPDSTDGRQIRCGKCKTPLDQALAGPIGVSDATFVEDVEQSPLPVLLDLWAEWCGPCHMLAPTIGQLASELAGRVRVAKLNIDENPSTAARYGIQSIPTLLLLKNGREIDRLIGVQPKAEILRRVQRLLE
jgi:thioredoxin 2